MERRGFIKGSALSLGLLALMQNRAWADYFDLGYRIKLLRGNVGIFTEQGGTIAWLANKEGIAVVDSEFPTPATHLIAELKKKSDAPFKYLINTHHHPDHTSGNIAFKGIVGQVVAHQNALANLQRVSAEKKNEDKQLFPTQVFENDSELQVGDEIIKLHYFGPGHTNGDSLIHFTKANIVHMGDLVFNRRFPYIDRQSGANIHNWIKVLDKAIRKFEKDTIFVFGHSLDPEKVTGSIEDLKAFQNYLERLLKFIDFAIKAGKTKEELKAEVSIIPGATDWQGEGIERSILAAYEELTAPK
jgi:glyoxylase-like metal-dependent hydrolase (beta-lactamase superfamily II)